jgi:hypothetical protein
VPTHLVRRLPEGLLKTEYRTVVGSPSCHLSLLFRYLRMKIDRPVGT